MFRRELAIAFRARVTWLVAAFAALLVGHGFVLAVDLYSAASRSALDNLLMRRELDPLAGIVRPTFGGVQLAAAMLVPIVAARVLAVEKERNTFGTLALALGSPARVLLWKLPAACLVALLTLVAPLVLFALFALLGGHLDPLEVGIGLAGHLLHVVLVAVISVAAAAWTRNVAQATTLAIVVSLASWAMEAGEGLAALAWLGPFEAAAVSRQLAPFEHALVSTGAFGWFGAALAGALALALLGARFDLQRRIRAGGAVLIAAATIGAIAASTRTHRAYDWTELRRASLPPAAVTELRALALPIEITVWLDREDSRRRQLESDTLMKLQLARPDLRIVMPLDAPARGDGAVHDDAYGRLVIRVGAKERETRSTSRREITTLIFEAAGRPLPDWSQPAYPGYPLVLDGARGTLVRWVAYGVVPGALLVIGFVLTRRRRIS
jgi:hypothetical protein